MKTINKILEERGIKSSWQGSAKTEEQMRLQVMEKFGSKVAKEYRADRHVMSLRQWAKFGVKIKPGESCLKTYTLIEDSEAGPGEQKRVRRSVPVFHYLQTDLVTIHE